jgi:ATP/maltotriose-dependent transcriptional regulator MalT
LLSDAKISLTFFSLLPTTLVPAALIPFGLTKVLFWITEGKTDPDIAMLCDISLRTVQKHVENIYRKLGVESRTAALRTALGAIV